MLRYKIIKSRGFTLAEILISALILVIAASGVFASFVAANRYVNMSKRRMAAVNLARQVSERLYTSVAGDTWTASGLLYCGVNNSAYPCNKTAVAGTDYTLDANNPLAPAGYSTTVTLTIDLVGDKVANPNCYIDCPRSVSVGVSWNE
ncbi:MAG: prepilin-type N-terminal cleavage/methylation domain-containing protein [Candidatus Omnitrophica bacterium]|nr:prepilin-type N-terminal cleavage/methylation domain-containing protein [Candidatus Omnitrophota bacterium]HOX54758.1 prepilin-type N-terminal cleavage/methylation domain-containing protein [Candidatus Omnitrophota bacterium]